MSNVLNQPSFLNQRPFLTETLDKGPKPGTPVNATPASRTIDPAGDGNAILWTARVAGRKGNRISVEYRDPGAPENPLSIETDGDDRGEDVGTILEDAYFRYTATADALDRKDTAFTSKFSTTAL